MNKEQSADDPSVDLIRVKNMYGAISMSCLMFTFTLIACIEHKVSLEAFKQWGSVGEAR